MAETPPRKPRKKAAPRKDGALVVVPDLINDDERANKAYWVRAEQHLTWDEVALAVGYPSPDAARVSVRSYLERAAIQLGNERRMRALEHELNLYDKIETVLMPRMLDGDLKAIDGIMRASMNRAKLSGLLDMEHEKDGTRTVVVSVERFAETMKEIALESQRAKIEGKGA